MDPNESFKELMKRSGWNQKQAAAALDLEQSSVSRYMNDIDPPSPQTLRLFAILLNLADGKSVETDPALKENFGDSAIWRDRARKAEVLLEELRSGMRSLLDRTSFSPVSSAAKTKEEEFVDMIEVKAEQRLQKAAEKKSGGQKPLRDVSPGTNKPHGS